MVIHSNYKETKVQVLFLFCQSDLLKPFCTSFFRFTLNSKQHCHRAVCVDLHPPAVFSSVLHAEML